MRRSLRPPIAIAVLFALAIMLSGCVGIRSGSLALTQPGGVGAVHLKFALCTLLIEVPKAPEEPPTVECGAVTEEPGEAQVLLGLFVPTGTSTPESFPMTPGPGSGPATFSRSAEVTTVTRGLETSPGVFGPPAGFEAVGYISSPFAETLGQEFTWTVDASLGLPPGAGGGSFGGPFAASVIQGWRQVGPGAPASRPINCEEKEPGGTVCGGSAAEVKIGVSDLKVNAPKATTVVPGARVKLPFNLDFASTAAEPPKFKLALSSTLRGAELSISNNTFARVPTEPGTNRAPATTRTALVQVPASTRLGSYELALKATAGQGGVATGATRLLVRPRGNANVTVPARVKAKTASGRGIPASLTAPIAGTRFVLRLVGPKPSGAGKALLARKVSTATELGMSRVRLRIGRARAATLLAAGAGLEVKCSIRQPGSSKPKRLVRRLTLR